MTGLLGAAEVRRLAAELELAPTKKLGQNFVVDANTVRRIVKAARLEPDDVVVEVGPGLGSLTLALLDSAREVVAIEIDDRLAARLPQTVAEHGDVARMSVINADALRVTGDEIRSVATNSAPTALVANLPYNVAVPVLLHLLEQLPSLRRILVMVQSEVADRLCAGPGSKTYGSPSAKLAWWGDAAAAGNVSRTIFWPVPGVDSSLVAVDVRGHPPVALAEGDDPAELRRATFTIIDAAFAQRRKMLRSALADWAGDSATAIALLTMAGLDPTARGEALPVTAFAALARVAVPFKS